MTGHDDVIAMRTLKSSSKWKTRKSTVSSGHLGVASCRLPEPGGFRAGWDVVSGRLYCRNRSSPQLRCKGMKRLAIFS